MVLYFRIIAIAFLLSGSIVTSSQTILLTENESRQVVKNLEAILTGGKDGFQSLKTNIKTAAKNVDSSFQARLAILPVQTKTASHIYYYKKFIYYFEQTEADIYTITQALRPLLSSDDFTEIYPEQQGAYTLTARAFASSNLVIEISYKIEKERKYSTIMLVKKEEYSSRPLTPLANNWEVEKIGFGFSYRANGRDSVVVTEVFANSPAAAAGLKKGDLINTINKAELKDKSQMQVAKIISKAEGNAEFSFLRNGKNQTVTIQKDWRYKYDKTCLSGDCANGTGVAMSKTMSGVLMEGKFKDGQLIEGNWFYSAKSLQEKGILFRKGKVAMDRFFTGNSYEPDKPDGGWWYQVTNHDLVKNFDIIEKSLNGYVKCYSNKTRKYLWTGEFENGKKRGDFAEYLYDKGFYWSYTINGEEKIWHRLKKLTEDKVGSEWLNDDVLNYNETTKTWSGWFLASLVSNRLSGMTRLENVSSYNDIETKAVAANSTPSSGNGGIVKTTSNKPSVPEVKQCGYCKGKGYTNNYFCNDCNNLGFVKVIGYEAKTELCVCIQRKRLYTSTQIENELKSRKEICPTCKGSGIVR